MRLPDVQTDTGTAATQDLDGALTAHAVRAVTVERLRRIADSEERLTAYATLTTEDVTNLGIANKVLLFDLLKQHVLDQVKSNRGRRQGTLADIARDELDEFTDHVTATLGSVAIQAEEHSTGLHPGCWTRGYAAEVSVAGVEVRLFS